MATEKRWRVGIIGCGWIATQAPDNHLEAYRDCPDTTVVALCDVKGDLMNGWKSVVRNDAKLFTDYKRMVVNRWLDIVSVCTPPETHCQIVCDIAPYVKAIYCEKPIALTLEDADRMIETCHKYGVILQVNHQRRFILVKARFSRDIIDTGTHMFDRLRQLFGELKYHSGRFYKFGNQWVEIEYVKSDEHIFEIDCVRSKEPMILEGVEHLVDCLDTHTESISSGEEARKSLELTLDFKEVYRA